MGSSNEEENTDEQKPQENGGLAYNGTNLENGEIEPKETSTEWNMKDGGGCCQGANGFTCCRDEKVEAKTEIAGNEQKQGPDACKKKFGSLTAWADTWEQGDVLAAVAVIGAVASVAVAYSFYRRR